MPFSLKGDLAALPGVEEVSAAIDLTDTYTVTSDKIQSSQMLADIWVIIAISPLGQNRIPCQQRLYFLVRNAGICGNAA